MTKVIKGDKASPDRKHIDFQRIYAAIKPSEKENVFNCIQHGGLQGKMCCTIVQNLEYFAAFLHNGFSVNINGY